MLKFSSMQRSECDHIVLRIQDTVPDFIYQLAEISGKVC